MADGKDRYGIPPGGNKGPYGVKYWAGIHYQLPWKELLASIALAGWPRTQWGLAAAIAAAESDRNPFVYNTYKMGHFGLFQISRSAWPEFFDQSKDNGLDWVSPPLNAKKAREIYKQQGWKAWESYTDGRYFAYYPVAMQAAANLDHATQKHGGDPKAYWESLFSGKTQDYLLKATGAANAIAGAADQAVGEAIAGAADATAQGTVDSGAAVASAVNSSFGWLPDLWTTLTTPAVWMRLAYGATGVVLVGGGLFLIVRNRPAVQQAARTVAKGVTP